jgi:two-component system OmpR family response regulator
MFQNVGSAPSDRASQQFSAETSEGGAAAAKHPVHVLVVDDNSATRMLVANYLEMNSMTVRTAATRAEMVAQLAVAGPHLVILDPCLGEEDGLDLLRGIRSHSDVPVIITTGHQRDEIDRVVGLELGADDYVTRPFGLRELLARIRAVLRRREPGRTPHGREPGQVRSRFEGWELDRRARRLTAPDGSPVTLTKGEHALLVAFLDSPQRPLTREFLLQATRVHEDVFDRTIDVKILRLRRKLETSPAAPRLIKTERGVGYVFTANVETQC